MKKTIKKSNDFIELCKKYGINPDFIPEITSLQDACKDQGLDAEKIASADFSMYPEEHRIALKETGEMFIIAASLNRDPETGELWRPDWNDGTEEKWGAWVDMEVDKNNPSGFRFGDSICACVNTISIAGSRLCYRNENILKFAFMHFKSKYRSIMVFEK